jgi:hypothetical protein
MKKLILIAVLFMTSCANPGVEIDFDDDVVISEYGFVNHYYVSAIHKLPMMDVPDEQLWDWSTCEASIMLKIVKDGVINLIELCPDAFDEETPG